MANVTLVVMAGGLGSRFGGAKQLAEVGPNGRPFWTSPSVTPGPLE